MDRKGNAHPVCKFIDLSDCRSTSYSISFMSRCHIIALEHPSLLLIGGDELFFCQHGARLIEDNDTALHC